MTNEEAEQSLERAKYLLCWQIVPESNIIFGKDKRASRLALISAFDTALCEILRSALPLDEKTKYKQQVIADFAALGTQLSTQDLPTDDFERFRNSTISGPIQ